MDIIQDAINHNKHVSKYDFIHEQTWDTFRARAAGKDIYLYGLGNAARYFIEAYSEKIKLCGVIDSYLKLQGFCIGDYLPEAVETSYDRVPIFDAGILETLPPEKSLILISNINAYEEVAEQMAAYHLECFVLLLMEADWRSHAQCGEYGGRAVEYTDIETADTSENINNTAYIDQLNLNEKKKAYADKCCSLPVERQKIVFMIGKYGGHAKSITEALIGKNSGLELVWLVDDLKMKLPEGVRPVFTGNWKRYIYEMETAHIWVFDILVPEWVRKRKGQIYLQTKHWSGITLKKFYLDDPSTTGTERERARVKENSRIMDYILVGSSFDQDTCQSGFGYHGDFVRVGSPRTDALFRADNRDKVYAEYQIDPVAHTVLYAPTFRYDKEKRKKSAVQGLDFVRLREKLEHRFGGKWKILFRGHPSLAGREDERYPEDAVIDVSGYDDSQELVAACDMLISDYSSIMFEAAFAGKAVLLFAPDKERYLVEERELYIDYDALPFPTAETNEELRIVIENFDHGAYQKRTAHFLEKYGIHEDGHASEKAAEFILSLQTCQHKISVIIPIYNTAAYLPRCIESVRNQTCRSIEIILVDDGSTDESAQICEVYAREDPRIIFIRQENRGNTAARKAGLRAAAGEYVMFVDSDDWIGSGLVSRLYGQARMYRADLVISNVLKIRVGGREEKRDNLITAGVYSNPRDAVKRLFFDYEEDCKYGILPYLFAKLYRRDLVARALEQIDDRMQYDEDRALVWTCLMQDITAVFTDCREYYYCQRAEGLVQARDEFYLAKINYFYCYMRRLFAQEEILRKQLERYVIWNVQIAFQWKLGMSENALPAVRPDFAMRVNPAVRPDSTKKANFMAESDPAESSISNIKVSVIIPSLNAAPYIGQCLDSVRRQTLQEIEILCVDAGSTDGTAGILKEYAAMDDRIHYLESDRKSYGFQMNLGIAAARGEYIGVVEPDDQVAEEMFGKLYDTAHGFELDYVKANFYKFMDYRGRRHYQKWERSYWGDRGAVFNRVLLLKENPRALVYGDHGNIWSGIYRREFLLDRKIRFHETPGASYQDTGFALLCTLEAERVMFLEDCFYYYRQGGTGTSVRAQDKHSTIIAEYAWIWEQMQDRGFTDKVCRSFYMVMKFHSYLWNYNRLRPEGRKRFLENLVKDEMLDFQEEILGFRIPEKDRMLRLWQGDWTEVESAHEAEERRRKQAGELLGILEKAQQIVVVCAGEWGRSLLRLYGKLGAGNLCFVCDNAPGMQGKTVEGRTVVSVEGAVSEHREHPGAYFMIANKRHAKELQEQLTGSGVPPERIYLCREEAYRGDKLLRFLLDGQP